jgi:hypothetical protein
MPGAGYDFILVKNGFQKIIPGAGYDFIFLKIIFKKSYPEPSTILF